MNLAARLQTHADLGGILLAHETYSLVKDEVLAEETGTITVKGFPAPGQDASRGRASRRGRLAGPRHPAGAGRVAADHRQAKLTNESRADVVRVLQDALGRLKD